MNQKKRWLCRVGIHTSRSFEVVTDDVIFTPPVVRCNYCGAVTDSREAAETVAAERQFWQEAKAKGYNYLECHREVARRLNERHDSLNPSLTMLIDRNLPTVAWMICAIKVLLRQNASNTIV